MRVLIHGLAMRKRGGGSRHLAGLTTALEQLGGEHEYLVYLHRDFPFSTPGASIQVHPVSIKSAFHRLWWDQIILPRLVREHQIDVVVALFLFGMFRPHVNQVVLQRNSQFYCEAYLSQLRGRERLNNRLRRQMAYWTMRASQITVPSAAMRDMIRHFHPDLPPDRFRVLPHGFSRGQLSQAALPDLLAQTLRRNQNQPAILYISHLEPHKGHEVALRAMRHLQERGQPCRLYLTMDRRDWPEGYDRLADQIQTWGLEQLVIDLGRVPEGALDRLYRQASVFFFPSLCESFGFPMVEALGYGLPIVAADTAVNREMCGEAALYYPPFDSEAAAQLLAAVLGSPTQRQALVAASEKQFPRSHLSWPKYARQFVEILEHVVAGTG